MGQHSSVCALAGRSGNVCRVLAALCVAASLTTLVASPGFRSYRPVRGASRADTPGVLQIERRISLARVAVSEILPGPSRAISMGTWNARNGSMASPTIRTRIVRELPALWRMRLPEDLTIGQVDVRYELTAPDGRVGRLVAADGPESVLTELRPLVPVVVSSDSGGAIVEGGLTLYLDLGSVRTAGRYTGTLTVTLDHF